MDMKCWHVAVSCVLLVCVGLTLTVGQECNPDIPHCKCQGSKLTCTGMEVKSLPVVADPKITSFRFKNCHLRNVSSIPYTKATMLELVNSGITSFTVNSFAQLQALEHLHITNNPLTVLPDNLFYNLTSLKKLDISNNKDLGKNGLPKNLFSHSESVLEELHMNGISLSMVPTETLRPLIAIKQLYISENAIAKLEDASFPGLATLELLEMNRCEIGEISAGVFKSIPGLTFLNLDGNTLSALDANTLQPLTGLQQLCLTGNQLATLTDDAVPKDNLKNIGLENNPWLCDCNIQWMSGFNLDVGCRNVHQNVTCNEPTEIRGMPVYNMTVTMSCPTKGSDSIAMAVAIPIIIICCLLIGFFLYRIIQNKRKAGKRKAVRYSAVYKETVESKEDKNKQPLSEMA